MYAGHSFGLELKASGKDHFTPTLGDDEHSCDKELPFLPS